MKIIQKEILAEKITRIEILAPDIAKKARPGQFIVLMASEKGERIPLTIVDKDPAQGAITLIFQEAGLTTQLLAGMKVGDSLYSLVGPLGHPTEIKKYTVNRASFVFKNAREQFEMRVHKRLIDILNPNQKIIEALTNLSLPSGVNIDVKMM